MGKLQKQDQEFTIPFIQIAKMSTFYHRCFAVLGWVDGGMDG